MLEYDQTGNATNENSEAQSSNDDLQASGKANSYGFTSAAQERMWMDQVRRECVKGYTNRIR